MVTGEIARVTTLSDILQLSQLPQEQQTTPELSPLVFPCGRAAAIAYMDNVFTAEFCDELIEYCQNNYGASKVGRTMGGVNLGYKVSRDWNFPQVDQSIEPVTVEEKFDSTIFSTIWPVIRVYKGTFPALNMPDSSDYCMTSDTGYQIQQYKQNCGFYNPHIDGSPWVQSSILRTLGMIVYLNTVDIGGGTNFPFHQTVINAVQGRVALFPAYWTHPHEGLMPLSSDKWIISTFVNCSNPGYGYAESCTCSISNESLVDEKHP